MFHKFKHVSQNVSILALGTYFLGGQYFMGITNIFKSTEAKNRPEVG